MVGWKYRKRPIGISVHSNDRYQSIDQLWHLPGGAQGDRPEPCCITAATAGTGAAAAYSFVPYDPSTVILGTPTEWFNPLMFQLGPAGTLGNASRDMLSGPGSGTWNLSINKDTRLAFLGEAGAIQFRAEIFNILNRANFTSSLPSGATIHWHGNGCRWHNRGSSNAGVGKISTTHRKLHQGKFQLAAEQIDLLTRFQAA